MVLLGVFLVSSLVFVACSDDDDFPKNTMGAVNVNSCVTTSTSATFYWTIVSNGTCAGYELSIFEGTREGKGTEVVNWTTDNPKEANHTFDGLKENTSYVVCTKAIPAPKSGFSSAETFELQFMTSPIVPVTNVEMEVMPTEVLDTTTGNYETVDRAYVTVTWKDIPASNCGDYKVAIYKGNKAEVGAKTLVKLQNILRRDNTTSYTFPSLELNTDYTVTITPVPNASCWYLTGDASYKELTTPAN